MTIFSDLANSNCECMLNHCIKQSTTWIKQVYNSLLNAHCIYCLQASQNNICPDCMAALPYLGLHCPQCSEPNNHGQLCGHCLRFSPAFNRVICPFEYNPPICDLIHHWKSQQYSQGPEQLTAALVDKLVTHSFDFVVPVPYHWGKLLKRGHNPVRGLGLEVSKALNTPLLDAIKRLKQGRNQQGLNRKQRLSNLRQTFALNKKYKMKLEHTNILLVDDVLTTGATCHHISKLLKTAGVCSITVACLARTPAKGS